MGALVLLRRPIAAKTVFGVDLEVEVRAIEVGPRGVVRPESLDDMVVHLDHLRAFGSQKLDVSVRLVEGERALFHEEGQYDMEGFLDFEQGWQSLA